MHQIPVGFGAQQPPLAGMAASQASEFKHAPEVAVLLPSSLDLKAFRPFGGCRLLPVSSVRELRSLLDHRRLAGIVSAARDEFGVPLRAVMEGRSGVPHDVYLTLYGRLSSDMSAQALELTAAGYRVRIALDGVETPATALQGTVDRGLPSDAQLRLLALVAAVRHPPLAHILVGAAVLGARRSSVADLCDATGLARRTLERRLKDAALPPAHRFLLDILVVHVLWQTEICGWSLKRIAARADFSSAALLRDCLRRHCRAPLRQVSAAGGFEGALSRVATMLRAAGFDDRQAEG